MLTMPQVDDLDGGIDFGGERNGVSAGAAEDASRYAELPGVKL